MDKKDIRIESIKVYTHFDDSPDTSYLGEYTDDLRPGVIVRALGEYYEKLPAPMERDSNGRFCGKGEPEGIPSRGREYRGFLPYAGEEKPGTKNYYKYGIQDFRRMEGLNNGEWYFVGIKAKAVVSWKVGTNGDRRLETLTSGGLWGIESDSGEYLKEVAQEEVADLKSVLETFGVNLSSFDDMANEAIDKMD